MTPKLEQIRINLDSLNIKLIHKVLTHLNVKWKNTETGEERVPSEREIEDVAEMCMFEAFKSENGVFSMGGFEAEVMDGVVGIKFVLTQANPLSKLFG